MGVLHGIRFWRKNGVLLTALGFPACWSGKYVEMPASMEQILLPGWCLSFPLLFRTSQRGADLAEDDTELWDPAALAPKAERDQLDLVTVALSSWLCLEDHQEPGPSFARSMCLEMSSWGKRSGQRHNWGQKGHMPVHIILSRKAQSMGNGKKYSVSKRNREKCGLRQSWSQLGCINHLDLELLAGLFY